MNISLTHIKGPSLFKYTGPVIHKISCESQHVNRIILGTDGKYVFKSSIAFSLSNELRIVLGRNTICSKTPRVLLRITYLRSEVNSVLW